MSILGKMFGWIGRRVVDVAKALRDFVRSDAVKQLLSTALGAIAEQVVSELQVENLANGEKRQAAIQRISAKALEQGLEVKESAIRLLVEIVVSKLKSVAN